MKRMYASNIVGQKIPDFYIVWHDGVVSGKPCVDYICDNVDDANDRLSEVRKRYTENATITPGFWDREIDLEE